MLTEWIGKHEGETAWIFGKGPSVDEFDMAEAGPLRVAINDVCRIVPGCRYVFANDDVSHWRQYLSADVVLFQPERAGGDITRIPCPVVVYRDGYDPTTHLPLAEFARCIEVRCGTLCSAIQTLHIMGVSRIILVGIDGTGAHSKQGQWSNRLRADSANNYGEIRQDAFRIARQLSIPLLFFTGKDQPLTKGTMKITIRKTIFVHGNPYQAGDTPEIDERTGRELIANRAADPFIEADAAPEKAAENPPAKVIIKEKTKEDDKKPAK